MKPLPPFDFQPVPYAGPSLEEILHLRRQFVNPAIFHYYREPLMVVAGRGQYLFDEKGRRYLDGFGGIVTVSVGHCHPHVVAAANLQNATLQHTTTIYLNPNIALYARALAARLPGDLKVCYFVNSGSEANDLALLMARACMKEACRHVRAAGGLCTADEVQTGFGRTGSHFWGFETQDVVPDIVTMAKGIGNGCPLGAVVTTPEIAACLAERIHFNTLRIKPPMCLHAEDVEFLLSALDEALASA